MRSRRLARKRRDRRQIVYDTSTDDEEKICGRIEDNSEENQNESENSDSEMNGHHRSLRGGGASAKHVEAEQDRGEDMGDTEENINESENSEMDMERSPSVSKRGTGAKGEQNGSEQMRDSDENMKSRTDMQPPPSVSVNNKDKANSATSNDYNTLTTRYSSFTPPAGWVINDEEYVDKVENYIECSLYKDLKKGHLHSFIERTQQNRDSYFKKKNTCFKQKIA